MAEMMRAVVLHGPGSLAVENVPVPEPGPGQQLVRVGACGICGSDLRYFAGENPWAKHTLGYEKPNPPDMILGHEIGGLAELSGQAVPVGCLSFRACGQCGDCRRGAEQLCGHTAHLGHGAGWEGQNPGGMAEWVPLWTEHLYPLPAGVTVEQATFLDALAVAVHAVRRAQVASGGSFVVFGGGPVGLLIAQTALALGAGTGVVVDVYDTPLACARDMGLPQAVNASGAAHDDLRRDLAQRCSGDLRAVFDTTGEGASQALGLGLLGAGGTLMLMAGVGEGLAVSSREMAGERSITSSANHRYEDFGIALQLLAHGRVLVDPMITHRFPLEQAAEAFAVATNKTATGALKVLLVPA